MEMIGMQVPYLEVTLEGMKINHFNTLFLKG